MHHPTHRIAHTTAFVTLVVEYWLELEPTVFSFPSSRLRDFQSDFSQCSMTGITKSKVCDILSWMMHMKDPLLLIRNSPCSGVSGLPFSLSGPLPYVHCYITVLSVLSASLNKTFPSS